MLCVRVCGPAGLLHPEVAIQKGKGYSVEGHVTSRCSAG